MAQIKFTDPEVEKRYEAKTSKDRRVEIPGVYAGMFSNITWSMARKMARQGCSNLLALKEGAKDDEESTDNQQKVEKPIDKKAADKPAGDGK